MPIIVVENVEMDPNFYGIEEDLSNPYEENVGAQIDDNGSLEHQIAELCKCHCPNCKSRDNQVRSLLLRNNGRGWRVETQCIFFAPEQIEDDGRFLGILPFLITRLAEGIGLTLGMFPPLGKATIMSFKTAIGEDVSAKSKRELVSCPVSDVLAQRELGLEDQ